MKQNSFLKFFANANIVVGLSLLAGNTILFFLFSGVTLNQQVQGFNYVERENQILSSRLFENIVTTVSGENLEFDLVKLNIPANSATTMGYTLEIGKIGVNTQIYESLNGERGLEKGVWRDPLRGRPDVKGLPTVLFAHRWGLDTLSNEYRSKNLFLNIPLLSFGDIVKLNWNSVEYRYRIDFVEVRQFASKESDLILVTCRDYTSPIRHIVHATKI